MNPSYRKTIYTEPKLFSIINNECDGCWFGDMTLDEHRQYVINKKQKIIKQIEYLKQQKLAKKVNRAKSFVGHYIIGEKNGVIVFVKGYYYDYQTDSSGNKIYRKRPDRIMTNYEDHVCHVCNGDGLISTQN